MLLTQGKRSAFQNCTPTRPSHSYPLTSPGPGLDPVRLKVVDSILSFSGEGLSLADALAHLFLPHLVGEAC